MRLFLFLKLMLVNICLSLLGFAVANGSTVMGTLKIFSLGTVISIVATIAYPEIRGIKSGDVVSVVTDSGIPSIIGRVGTAENSGRKNEKIKITLNNGSEVVGIIESYTGIISPPRIRAVYEEKLIEQ